jgi:hypothetical protein
VNDPPTGPTTQSSPGPRSKAGLTGDWTTSTAYPAVGGLTAETVTTSYDTTGRPIGAAGLDTYVADTRYTYWGAASQQLLGTGPKQVKLANTVDEATGRLTQLATSTQTGPTSFGVRAASIGIEDRRREWLEQVAACPVVSAARTTSGRVSFPTGAVQPPARVNVTWVTPLGEEVASTW